MQVDCSMDTGDWTPYNSNLHMQGIKVSSEDRRDDGVHCIVQVLVDAPCPDVKKENAFEDTLFLIDILRQTKARENKQKKVGVQEFIKIQTLSF